MKGAGKTTGAMQMHLLPRLAWRGIVTNKNVSYPFLGAGIFSVFIYFVFTSILKNDIVKLLPRSSYAWSMLALGKGLLAIILLVFLIYANSFLVKRRMREFGLYQVLGLEKRHIGMMALIEMCLLYAGALLGGVLFGVVFAKLLFLLLLRICRLSVDVPFSFELSAFVDAAVYFAFVYGVNGMNSLRQVRRAEPIELLGGSRKGEKEPKFLRLSALLGVAAIAYGYYISVTAQIDSWIFTAFFGAVFLVIAGTYFLFTSGSVAFLKWIKKRRGLYYRPKNFITVSGMLYRMKKNAAGLSNICIFSTMTVITLICTVTLAIGLDACVHFDYPYDLMLYYEAGSTTAQEVEEKTAALSEKYRILVERADLYHKIDLPIHLTENHFELRGGGGSASDHALYRSGGDKDDYALYLLTQEEYNRVEHREVSLAGDEVLLYSSGRNFGYDSLTFMGREFRVQEELRSFFPYPKAERNGFNMIYVMVVKDRQVWEDCVAAWCEANGIADISGYEQDVTRQNVKLLLGGVDKEKAAYIEELAEWGQGVPGFYELQNGLERRENMRVMYGALLFVGILLGLIFFMCLILIMYYKQITEGYEDRDGFAIMQKVGMDEEEIRSTVRRQVLMVFGLPLVGALLHTAAGMFMVGSIFAVISLFDMRLLAVCSVVVSLVFVVVYGVSYLATARTYYRIVKH